MSQDFNNESLKGLSPSAEGKGTADRQPQEGALSKSESRLMRDFNMAMSAYRQSIIANQRAAGSAAELAAIEEQRKRKEAEHIKDVAEKESADMILADARANFMEDLHDALQTEAGRQLVQKLFGTCDAVTIQQLNIGTTTQSLVGGTTNKFEKDVTFEGGSMMNGNDINMKGE